MIPSTRNLWRPCLASALCALATVAWAGPQEPSHQDHGTAEDHGHSQNHGHPHGHSDSEYRHSTMHHDFSDAEHWSARFDTPERKAWQQPEQVANLLDIEPGMTVVDLGAGTGYFLSYLSAAAGETGRVLGLDPEADMVRFMGERAQREKLDNVESRRIPYDNPELAAGSVDRILIVNTWHHIQERGAYARKLTDALRPGGAVYIVDFTEDSPSGPPVEERLAPQQVMGELTEGGLQAEMVDETLPRQYVVVGRRAE